MCVQVPHSSPAPGASRALGAVNETGRRFVSNGKGPLFTRLAREAEDHSGGIQSSPGAWQGRARALNCGSVGSGDNAACPEKSSPRSGILKPGRGENLLGTGEVPSLPSILGRSPGRSSGGKCPDNPKFSQTTGGKAEIRPVLGKLRF